MSTRQTHAPPPTRLRPAAAARTRSKRPSPRGRPNRPRWVGWAVAAGVAAVAVVGIFAGGRSEPTKAAGAAPAFQLASTSGQQVSLSEFRGKNVLLYFNEGVGCDACFYQTASIEADGALARAGVTLVPVVMNSAPEVQGELRRFGIRTPYLLDPDGSASRSYRTLGTGHHAGLPGHSFVLVGSDGRVRWRGDYPGMWVEPKELTGTVMSNLR